MLWENKTFGYLGQQKCEISFNHFTDCTVQNMSLETTDGYWWHLWPVKYLISHKTE